MDKIRKGLYISGVEEAVAILQGRKHGITHVLSMIPDMELFKEMRDSAYCGANVKRLMESKVVPLADTDWETLLDRLDECLDFIEAARKQGGEVLVHCIMGVSRSASVVVAYLMRTEHLTVDAAVCELKRFRPIVKPNPGFLKQLGLFEKMGYKVDKRSAIYRDFCNSRPGLLSAALDKGFKLTLCHLAAVDDGAEGTIKCKSCDRKVAARENRVQHGSECKFIFLEPMRWMKNALGKKSDKLCCDGCGGLLGRFHWRGSVCQYCGVKVTPSFQLLGYKVVQEGQ